MALGQKRSSSGVVLLEAVRTRKNELLDPSLSLEFTFGPIWVAKGACIAPRSAFEPRTGPIPIISLVVKVPRYSKNDRLRTKNKVRTKRK